jgi:sec-independent protein translocase protein TatB
MFDISFGELLVVMVLAVVFIGPKELPVVVRAVARAIFQIKKFMLEVKSMMNDLAHEAGVDDIKREMEEEFSRDIKMIQGEDGEWYESYTLNDFVKKDVSVTVTNPSVASAPQPASENDKEGA